MNKNMFKKAQQLQRKMADLQEELESASVEATSGGGMVTVVVNGKMKLETITIDPEVVSVEDLEMLQDLVHAAVNEGLEQAQNMVSDRMGALTGGMKLPGLF